MKQAEGKVVIPFLVSRYPMIALVSVPDDGPDLALEPFDVGSPFSLGVISAWRGGRLRTLGPAMYRVHPIFLVLSVNVSESVGGVEVVSGIVGGVGRRLRRWGIWNGSRRTR
jgi:hypothetical protein